MRRALGVEGALALAAGLLLAPVAGAAQDACAGSAEPVEMQMLLEKTLFNVDVLWLTVRIRGDAAERLRDLDRGGELTDAMADSVAWIAAHARCGGVRLDFVRDVSLDRYFDATRSSLGAARKAGFITAETQEFVSSSLPEWYEFIEGRGVRDRDRMIYRIRGDTLRIEYHGADGDLLLDRTDVGARRRRALLGGYFAPGSDFRERLIRSFARGKPVMGQSVAAAGASP